LRLYFFNSVTVISYLRSCTNGQLLCKFSPVDLHLTENENGLMLSPINKYPAEIWIEGEE
jgi:hypothetical protein